MAQNHPPPPGPPPGPGGTPPPDQNPVADPNSAFKGDVRGSLSKRFRDGGPAGGGDRTFENRQQFDRLMRQMEDLRQQEQRVRLQIAPFESGYVMEQANRPEFAVEVAPFKDGNKPETEKTNPPSPAP
ncbi:MAG: hypothetical protein PHV34_10125 [Verrucomicrobiae bacterium]|nr:hypothetical protein [Verrucomicrobiae bacterium]